MVCNRFGAAETWTRAPLVSPQVTRGGAGKIFSADSTATGVVPSRLSPWEKTENKTAKAAAAPGSGGAGGGEGSTAALSAAEKSALLKRMIMVIRSAHRVARCSCDVRVESASPFCLHLLSFTNLFSL